MNIANDPIFNKQIYFPVTINLLSTLKNTRKNNMLNLYISNLDKMKMILCNLCIIRNMMVK